MNSRLFKFEPFLILVQKRLNNAKNQFNQSGLTTKKNMPFLGGIKPVYLNQLNYFLNYFKVPARLFFTSSLNYFSKWFKSVWGGIYIIPPLNYFSLNQLN
jgi:hypothetical protein